MIQHSHSRSGEMTSASAKPNEYVRKPTKLSTGIMGMKFMQKDEDSSRPPASSPGTTSESSKRTLSVGFQHDKDPGEWFAPSIEKFKPLGHQDASKTISFGDIYGTSQEVFGRRIYGPNSQVSNNAAPTDPKNPGKNKSGQNKPKDSKQKQTRKGTKRSSDTEYDLPRAATDKRRKS